MGKRATLTDLLNDLTFRTTYDKYKGIAMSRFEWGNLPGNIVERYIERELFSNGKAIAFKRPDGDFMILKVEDDSKLNVYGDPLFYRAVGFGGKTYKIPRDECVIIENNILRQATEPFIMFYANKITEAERTMDVNIKSNKAPVVFACDQRQLLSFKNLFAKVDGNEPAIFTDKGLDLNSIAVFDTKAKFLCGEIMDYKKAVENELLTFLGVNNIPVEKKERLITDEAQSNNQLINSFSDMCLEARERACKEINEKFGLKISVKRRGENVEKVVENVDNSVQ